MRPTKEEMHEIVERSKALYEQGIRKQVETDENIGKVIVIDALTGEYEIDDIGMKASARLRKRLSNPQLFSLRIGYKAEETLGGIRERNLA